MNGFKKEIQYAQNINAEDTTYRIIPAVLPGGSAENILDFLRLHSWIDFSNEAPHTNNIKKLAAQIRDSLINSITPPPQSSPPLSDDDLDILRIIASQGRSGCTYEKLHDVFTIPPTKLQEQIHKLITKGLITETWAEHFPQEHIYHITPKGRSILQKRT